MSQPAQPMDRVSAARTAGERLFEEYLHSQGIDDFEYEKTQPGKRKKIDYTVTLDREYLFDVKDFTAVEIAASGAYDAHKRLRKKIDHIREQFKEYKAWPCCAVLHNDNAALVDLTTPFIVFGAMYGNLGVRVQFDTTTGERISETTEFMSGGKMLFRKLKSLFFDVHNSTISALITLRYVKSGYARLCRDFSEKRATGVTAKEWIVMDHGVDSEEEHLGVIVWENSFARIPFPREIFCGEYDERYGLSDQAVLTRLFAGTGIVEYEELMGEQRSPVFTMREREKR